VARVLRWEGARGVRVELTLLAPTAMRRLNRRATGRRGLTDVLSFPLPQPSLPGRRGRDALVGDVYICPAAARRWVREAEREEEGGVERELVRLAVHGTLHVLGWEHPEGPGRTRSAMWRRQERYVQRLAAGGR
jgi:probable rRNA maturation factor